MKEALLVAEGLVAGWEGAVTPPLDLTVAAGEIVGLVGPNGVGKSTCLAALVGAARIFAGRAAVAPGVRLNWQTQAPPPLAGLPLCGSELLALTGAAPAGLPPWLAGCLDRRLDRLSGGQRHFLALWAVLQAPGELVFLDEPTNHLDLAGVRHLQGSLRQRAREGAGILLVSHDHDFVAAVCDRVVQLGEARHD